jgi:hypothetical protein
MGPTAIAAERALRRALLRTTALTPAFMLVQRTRSVMSTTSG